MTNSLGENGINPVKKQEKSVLKLNLINSNKLNMSALQYIRDGKKYNEIQLTKNKMDLNNRK